MRGFRLRKRLSVYRRRLRMPRVLAWMRRKAGGFLNRKGSGYVRLGPSYKAGVPKGHLAVCVGQKEDDCCQALVPVVYFNHPLFGRLLSEAEDKFGFEYPGRITIPCPVSEFRSVTTRIEAAVGRKYDVTLT